MLMRTRLIITL